MDDVLIPVMVVAILFIGLPWLILHYVSQWKANAVMPVEDERLLDDLYELARRLEDRVHTVERIVAADNPEWRPSLRGDTRSDSNPRLREERDYHDGRDQRDERDERDYQNDEREPRRLYRQQRSM